MTTTQQLAIIKVFNRDGLARANTDPNAQVYRDMQDLFITIEADRVVMRDAMNELGVPQPDYPSPVTTAYELLNQRLQE